MATHSATAAGSFTKHRIKCLFKATERLRDADGEWLAPRVAAAYCDVCPETLAEWRKHGCLWIGGKKLVTRKFGDGPGRLTRYYLRSQLEQAIAAATAWDPAEDGGQWVSVADAAAQYRWNAHTFFAWLREGCPYLDGKKPRSKKAVVMGDKGQPHLTRFAWRKELEEIQRIREASPANGDWLPIRRAAERLDVTTQAIGQWVRNGLPGRERSKLTAKWARVCCDRPRMGWLVATAEIEEIERRRMQLGELPHADAQGTWLPASLATERYPNATVDLLKRYRNKPCSWLAGAVLRARRIRRQNRGPGRRKRLWVYLEDDLKLLTAPGTARERVKSIHGDNEGAWHPLALACELTGLTPVTLHELRNDESCHYLDGRSGPRQPVPAAKRPLRAKHVRNPAPKKRQNKRMWVYHQDDLRIISERRQGRLPAQSGPGNAPRPLPAGDWTQTIKVPTGHRLKPRPRTGRPWEESTFKVGEFCYQRYVVRGDTRAQVLQAARAFGDDAPATEKDVADCSKRYANRFEPPLSCERPK
jgi:hypothetical protein